MSSTAGVVDDARAALTFGSRLYSDRLATAYHALWHRDLLARLHRSEGRENPYGIYALMRPHGPLMPTRLGNYTTVDHAVADEILRSDAFGVQPLEQAETDDDFDLSFLDRNEPDHGRLRKVAAPAFRPRMIRSYEDRITALVDDLVDRIEHRGRADFIADLAAPLPITIITTMFGIDGSAGISTEEFARHGAALGGSLDGIHSLRHARELMAAGAALEEMFDRLIRAREDDPRDDLISMLTAERGDRVRAEELVPMCILLLVAGFETTVNLLGNALRALLEHPEQWRMLTESPELAPQAVEETLRWDPPVQRTARVAFHDQEVAGAPVHKDQWVVLLLGGTGRDPAVFKEPDRFDITRPISTEHLAFSSGIHYCLGAPLARLEAATALRVLATRLPHLHRAGPIRMRRTTLIRGPLHLPISAS